MSRARHRRLPRLHAYQATSNRPTATGVANWRLAASSHLASIEARRSATHGISGLQPSSAVLDRSGGRASSRLPPLSPISAAFCDRWGHECGNRSRHAVVDFASLHATGGRCLSFLSSHACAIASPRAFSASRTQMQIRRRIGWRRCFRCYKSGDGFWRNGRRCMARMAELPLCSS